MPTEHFQPQPPSVDPDQPSYSRSQRKRSRLICFSGFACLSVLLTGCTTYTWPDGSRETLLGVPPEEENSRYEEDHHRHIEYQLPGQIPANSDVQE